MVVFPMKEIWLVIIMDDLDFEVKDVTFEAKMFNRSATFDRIANRSMEDLNYAHLHCDLLNKVALTTIILKGVKSPHKNIHEQYLQKCMFVCVKKFGIESTFPKGDLKKVTCMLLQLSQQPICHQSLLFNLN